MKPNIEILAPAGSFESLTAAVFCGADAVYLGGKELSARRSAQNFDPDELTKAVEFAHLYGVKIYLTLNTIVFDRELPLLCAAIKSAATAGVDAFIIQDLAVLNLVKAICPNIPLHASTQMSVHNLEGVGKLEDLGFSRVVLARELSLHEIANITKHANIPVECFVHGALCMSISGQCYLSSVIGGRSGNRGMCAQPCRLPFSAGSSRDDYALSLKDLSLVSQLSQLADIGVASIKIEGRMKRAEYVAAAVKACRDVLDKKTPDFSALQAVFSRSGFTAGYFDNNIDQKMFGIRAKEDVAAASSTVLKKLAALYSKPVGLVGVAFSLTAEKDLPMTLSVGDDDGNRVVVSGDIPLVATVSPTDPQKAVAVIEKTGSTAFYAVKTDVAITPGLLLPASSLSAMRRQALEILTQTRRQSKAVQIIDNIAAPTITRYSRKSPPQLRVRIHRANQLSPYICSNAQKIIISVEEIEKLPEKTLRDFSHKIIAELPTILFDEKKLVPIFKMLAKNGIKAVTAGNLYAISAALKNQLKIHGDSGLNITNTLSLVEYQKMGLTDATLSFELDLAKANGLGGEVPRGIIAYGNLPLMQLRNCPVKASRGCKSCGNKFPPLTDRLGKKFFVDCRFGVTTLYNCLPLYLGDKLDDFYSCDFFTLYFTKESSTECENVFRSYQNASPSTEEITRGLYYRKVL